MKLGMCGFTIGAAAYFQQFPVVEVQQTFYDPPPIATLAKWRRHAPVDFEFTMKAWQVITHRGESPTYRRLRRAMTAEERADAGGFRTNETTLAAWRTTLEARDALGATAILFQCPASFRPTADNVAAMLCALQQHPSRQGCAAVSRADAGGRKMLMRRSLAPSP